MKDPTWKELVVVRTMKIAAPHHGQLLRFLLIRLEGHPEALPAIAVAMRDLSGWTQAQAEGLEAVVKLRRMARMDEPEGGAE